MTAAFLKRRGANPIAERPLADAIGLQRLETLEQVAASGGANSGMATGKRRHKPFTAARPTPAFPSEWKMSSFDGKGNDVVTEQAVWPSKWKGFSLDGKGTDVSDSQAIRDIANSISLNFGTTAGGSPNI